MLLAWKGLFWQELAEMWSQVSDEVCLDKTCDLCPKELPKSP